MAQSVTDVAIIGAGSTGLLLAQALKSAGITYQIYERQAKDSKSREWSMSLHWGGEFLAKLLPPALQDRQGELDVDPNFKQSEGFVQCNGETGETILLMPGVMPRRVSRRKMKALLSEGMDIQFDKELESIQQTRDTAIAAFSDGSTVTAKVIIGCDGSRSQVRKIVVGDDKLSNNVDLPYTLFNFPCSYPEIISVKLQDIHPVFKVAYHPKLNMMYLLAMADASSENPAEWKHQNLISWSGPPHATDLATPDSRLARLKEIGSTWAHPWSTAIANVPDDTEIFVDSTSQWDPRSVFKVEEGETMWNGNNWHGIITLAGDAAHTMLPHRGQGLNNALQDAAELYTALVEVFQNKSKDLKTAITQYEKEMVARGGLEVEITSRQAGAAHNWEILMQSPMFKHGANKAT